MAMGRRGTRQRQPELWVATADIVRTPGHAFYTKLEELLVEHHFDRAVEHLCRRFYKGPLGQPSLAPGIYFRCLLIGFFEGLDSERGIAWRVADSLSLRAFLGYGIDQPTPDHTTIARTRRLYWVSTHKAVSRWVLRRLKDEGLLVGKTIGIDATTLEANAAMRSIVRRDTGEGYDAYVTTLAEAAGLTQPTREALARFDRTRKKKGSNQEWQSPADPDARIAKMKDGRTHLAHKAEHAVDLASGALVAVTLQPADRGDTTTVFVTLARDRKFNRGRSSIRRTYGAIADPARAGGRAAACPPPAAASRWPSGRCFPWAPGHSGDRSDAPVGLTRTPNVPARDRGVGVRLS
ncbi:hypothetical protein BH09GEM1_BH09GEM1_45190 [soil metagenome]